MSISPSKKTLSRLRKLALLLLFPFAPHALADSNAGVSLWEPYVSGLSISDFQSNSAIPATATLGNVTGRAKSVIGTGSVGVGMEMMPGSLFGFYTATADWYDYWTASGATNVGATLTLSGHLSTSLLTNSDDFWELSFRYAIDGNYLLSFTAFSDGGPAVFHAYSDTMDLTSSILFTPNGANPLLTDFSLSYNPTFATTGAFSESMTASMVVDGAGPMSIDAFNSFHSELASLDPSVTLTSEAGRSVAAIPEPETYAMLVAGLGLLGFAARRRKQKEAAFA